MRGEAKGAWRVISGNTAAHDIKAAKGARAKRAGNDIVQMV